MRKGNECQEANMGAGTACVLSSFVIRCRQREWRGTVSTAARYHKHNLHATGAARGLCRHAHSEEVAKQREVVLERVEQARQKLGGVAVVVGAGARLAAHSTKQPHKRDVLAAQKTLQASQHPVVDFCALGQASLHAFQ